MIKSEYENDDGSQLKLMKVGIATILSFGTLAVIRGVGKVMVAILPDASSVTPWQMN